MRVLVKTESGRKFPGMIVKFSDMKALLLVEQWVPEGSKCDVRFVHVQGFLNKISGAASMQAEVNDVIFASPYIHLELHVSRLGREAKRILESGSNFSGVVQALG